MLLSLTRITSGFFAILLVFALIAPESVADVAADQSLIGADQAVEIEAAKKGYGDSKLPPILQFDIGSAVVNICIFVGLLAILSKFVWPQILGGLQAREEKINSDLEGASRLNAEARSLLEQYQLKLDDAQNQVQAMLAETRKDSELSSQRILADARVEAEKVRDRAVADIETAKKVALTELAGSTSDMVIQVAKHVVQRELQPADHADMIRQSLEHLPSKN